MKTFIYFLLDTPTGKAYYRDSNGTLKTTVITAGTSIDVSLKNAPANWLDTELSFIRNTTYHGINRSFTTPQEFVRDAATIIKELFLLGIGTEVPLTVAIFKYNSQPKSGEPQYKLYYKGNLDLPKMNDTVLESLTINLMEGGILQLLKSYENTVLEIPCDGKLIENQKINLDGLLVPDVFYYTLVPINNITPVNPQYTNATPLPCVFVNNEGDNYGIIHNDPTFETIQYSGTPDTSHITNYCQTSVNYFFLSVRALTATFSGSVSLKFVNPASIQLFLCTSKGQLITLQDKYFGENYKVVTFNFNTTVTLAANESVFLFIQIYNTTPLGNTHLIDVLNGSFSVAFESQAAATRVWAIAAYDLFKLIIKQICLLASTTDQPLNYEATSNLLQQNGNIFITSGDALRASGDSTYQRYYSLTEQNQILQTSFGPVIKITLKEFFESMEVILKCAMGVTRNAGKESIFIEAMESVYDSSVTTFDIGEVASLKWKYAEDLSFSDLEIGYPPQSYDQKAGKYEYNTMLVMKAPVKSFQKKLSKISKIRWDSYGIERLRSNIGDATSTTRNDNDTSVFGINADMTKWIMDYFDASFTSLVTDPNDPQNTNVNLEEGVSCQQIALPTTDGEYFHVNNDNAIIIFSVPGFSSSENCTLIIAGLLNSINPLPGAPADTFTLKLWHNGNVIYTYSVTYSAVDTPISINHSFTETFNYKDCLYITMSTTATGQANINSASLAIGAYVSMSAVNIPVDTGTAQKLLSWDGTSFIPNSKPYIINSSVVQYGFQYFVFNSLVPNTNFLMQASFNLWLANKVATFVVDVYVNGVLQSGQSATITGTTALTSWAAAIAGFSKDYALNDIVFISASIINVGGGIIPLTASLTYADIKFSSNYIKAYSLKRVNYDFLKGIPVLTKDSNGNIRTDLPGSPYNIEDITPKTVYNKWKNYIASCFMNMKDKMKFQTLSKNSFLSRSYNSQVTTENTDEDIDGTTRLFYPIEIEVKTNVPIGFADLLSNATNAHIHCTFMGNDIYFFANSLIQKPALNESQTWKGILSPKTDLNIFSQINSFKLPDMANNSISCAFAASVQFVPYNQTLANKYHTYNRDTFLFTQQTGNWLNKDNYGQPVQIGDIIPLQFITNGLDPVAYTVYNCDGTVYIAATNLNTVASPAVTSPYVLWQTLIDTTTWAAGIYYIIITAGVGGNAATLISEPLAVQDSSMMEDTVLIEYTNSFNTQGIIFDGTPAFVGAMRIRGGFDNKFKQKYLGKFYIDQPQDITVLNAIPYEVTTLLISGDSGVPDYVPKKIIRMLLMDGCTLDGEAFSLNEGAQFEEVFTKGAPMKLQKIEIRPRNNKDGINVVASGVDTESSMIVSVNANSFGPNISNESGTTETDLIDIKVG